MVAVQSFAPPKRILLSAYACEPGRGSEPGVGWNWALTLARQGYAVWVITRENNRPAIERELVRLDEASRRNLSFRYYDLPRWARWWKKGGRGIHLYYALWQRAIYPLARALHREVDFDLVHHITFGVWRQPSTLYRLGVPFIFGPIGGGEMAPWALERGLPVAAISESLARASANVLALFNPWLRCCLRRSTLVVAKTRETAAWVARAGGTPAIALEIGIDATGIRPRTADSTRASGALRCVYAGRLIGMKGVHLALAGVAGARARGADVTLTIIGLGPMRTRLVALAEKLGVAEHVQFIDWLAQPYLFEQYRAHDALLFPSLRDSSGNVILEAFAHGLPAVCLDLGGPAALVDASCGVVVATDGRTLAEVTSALAVALNSLWADRERLESMARRARALALTATWHAAVTQTYRLLTVGTLACAAIQSDKPA